MKQEKIKQALKQIYEGKTDIKLDEEELKGVLKEMAHYVNDIAGGFSNAIKENLKSERLKTELITNVSHDIKTPLKINRRLSRSIKSILWKLKITHRRNQLKRTNTPKHRRIQRQI